MIQPGQIVSYSPSERQGTVKLGEGSEIVQFESMLFYSNGLFREPRTGDKVNVCRSGGRILSVRLVRTAKTR